MVLRLGWVYPPCGFGGKKKRYVRAHSKARGRLLDEPILARNRSGMEEGFRRILARLPFPVLQIHPDNGSEFFNHKNDNRFVERKKATLVRAYLGYDRLDTVAQTLAINQLYDKMWLYFDFFSRRDP